MKDTTAVQLPAPRVVRGSEDEAEMERALAVVFGAFPGARIISDETRTA